MEQLYKPRPDKWPPFTLRRMLVIVTVIALSTLWATAIYQDWKWRLWRAEFIRNTAPPTPL